MGGYCQKYVDPHFLIRAHRIGDPSQAQAQTSTKPNIQKLQNEIDEVTSVMRQNLVEMTKRGELLEHQSERAGESLCRILDRRPKCQKNRSRDMHRKGVIDVDPGYDQLPEVGSLKASEFMD